MIDPTREKALKTAEINRKRVKKIFEELLKGENNEAVHGSLGIFNQLIIFLSNKKVGNFNNFIKIEKNTIKNTSTLRITLDFKFERDGTESLMSDAYKANVLVFKILKEELEKIKNGEKSPLAYLFSVFNDIKNLEVIFQVDTGSMYPIYTIKENIVLERPSEDLINSSKIMVDEIKERILEKRIAEINEARRKLEEAKLKKNNPGNKDGQNDKPKNTSYQERTKEIFRDLDAIEKVEGDSKEEIIEKSKKHFYGFLLYYVCNFCRSSNNREKKIRNILGQGPGGVHATSAVKQDRKIFYFLAHKLANTYLKEELSEAEISKKIISYLFDGNTRVSLKKPLQSLERDLENDSEMKKEFEGYLDNFETHFIKYIEENNIKLKSQK